ncbi:MAG: hypothetical protein JXQ73_00960 [Phycisphaerae bacterium]|nr:hypothetical protein [Phycisphaerae bacterium]
MAEETKPDQTAEDFVQQAQEARGSLVREFIDFLMHNKKWWLLPILIVMGLLVALIFIGGSGGGIFVYTLF